MDGRALSGILINEMPTYKLTVEYCGTPFSGWQIQKGKKTVQGELTRALSIILRKPHIIYGASRTDAGVHALGHVASFSTDEQIDTDKLLNGLSALCRPHIAVTDVLQVPDEFHARFDTEGKHYEYKILNRQAPSPLFGFGTWHVRRTLDIKKMADAAQFLTGTHDFAAFMAADCQMKTTVRTIFHASVEKREHDIIVITIKGTAFLKYMVRIIAGTLVDIGRAALPVDQIKKALKTQNRSDCGQTAPACGLTLIEVYYPDGWIRDKKKVACDGDLSLL
jgi:tRNA pseudouridine38-40 synthase